MAAFERCAIDAHVAQIIGVPELRLAELRAYQDRRLREMFGYAKRRSPFYAALYAGLDAAPGLADWHHLPLIGARELRQQGTRMLCVPQEEIARIYTLDTGGTTGQPKRLYFTAAEIEQTVAYFRAGIPMFMAEGDRALVLLPCARENSVGRIFGEAARRLGAAPVYYGLPEDEEAAFRLLRQSNVNMVLAAPQTMLALSRYNHGGLRLKTILLSTDQIAAADKRMLAESFDAQVFEHYGMTEMCFGGGVDCSAFAGYHLREADFWLEIVDEAGKPLPAGAWGEIVLTTLRRTAMPLLRYATGDIGRFLPQPCRCGSVLPLLDRIKKRENPKMYGS